MDIQHDLLPAQKSRKYSLKETIDLYSITTELYNELNAIGIIDRMKEIPQLGVIKVEKKLSKSRYDYAVLQLYLHQLIRKNAQYVLKLSYSNCIKKVEFNKEPEFINKIFKPTIADILQLLSIIYNIGHFYNTFTSSRAIVMSATKNSAIREMLLSASNDTLYKELVNKILSEKNYQRFHLINSFLVLERCNQNLLSVKLAKELLYAYVNESSLSQDSKLKFVFDIFRKVRTLSYMAYDLQIAKTPIVIDIANEEAMLILIKEWLSEYNNTLSTNSLMDSVSKLLNDTVYNENSNAICYYEISRKIANKLNVICSYDEINYYDDLFEYKQSIVNTKYSHRRDYVEQQILKLTFSQENRDLSSQLLQILEKINNVRVGYYDRHSGEQTIVVSIKKSCTYTQKIVAALKIIKKSISLIKKIEDISSSDPRFILCTKFFLFYLFQENPIVIKPTIDEEKCVFCTKGKISRIREVKHLIDGNIGDEDQKYECNFMLKILSEDKKNDTTITVPGSILVYCKSAIGKKLAEFDGMIIHPFRVKEQVIFLESKNITNTPSKGKKEIEKKFKKLNIVYEPNDINVIDSNAFMKYSI